MRNGKGDSPRSCFSPDFKKNYDKIFRARQARPVAKRDRHSSKAELRPQNFVTKDLLD
jgi:hypothetical protein